MLWYKLSRILGERDLSINKLSKMTGITRPALTALALNRGKGVQLETLNTICKVLNIVPSDLFGYIPMDISINITDKKYTRAGKKVVMTGHINFNLYNGTSEIFDFVINGFSIFGTSELPKDITNRYECDFELNGKNKDNYHTFIDKNEIPYEFYSIIPHMVEEKADETIENDDKNNVIGGINMKAISCQHTNK